MLGARRGGGTDMPTPAVLVAPHRLARVIDHVDLVRELPHYIVVCAFQHSPFDGGYVLCVGSQLKESLSSDGLVAEPMYVVDYGADVDLVQKVREVPVIIVLIRVVEEWQVHLQPHRT